MRTLELCRVSLINEMFVKIWNGDFSEISVNFMRPKKKFLNVKSTVCMHYGSKILNSDKICNKYFCLEVSNEKDHVSNYKNTSLELKIGPF